MKKLFSIITPVYNAEKKLEKTLSSVLQQDDKLYELIIIDGNSNDNTIKIIDKYNNQYPDNIRYISEPDKGIYDAMNKGIDYANGEYLYFLGAGDTLKENVLKKIKPHLTLDLELVYGNVFFEAGNYNMAGKFDKKRICFDYICHQSIFYKKELFELLGKYSLDYPIYADAEFNLRCFGNDKVNTKYLDMVIANYEGRGFSTTASDDKFLTDKGMLILNTLGEKYYKIYKNSSCKLWLNEKFIELLNKQDDFDVIIFGAGNFGKNVLKYINDLNERDAKQINVKFFSDNDRNKWNKKIMNREIRKPEPELFAKIDKVVIASMPGKIHINNKLINMGIEKDKIIFAS